jgi:hypothetical protein
VAALQREETVAKRIKPTFGLTTDAGPNASLAMCC